MMKKSRNLSVCAAVFAVVLLSLSLSVVFTYAQYVSAQTADVTIPADGVSHIEQNSTVGGVSIDISGTAGANGTVSTAVYLDNPQPDATEPSNVTLTNFVVITFNIASSDFQGANITISYAEAEASGLTPPFAVYKYIPENNTFISLNGIDDPVAKTLTVSVASTTDPLFAIGAATVTNPPSPDNTWMWAIVVVVAVVVVLVAVLVLRRRKGPTLLK